MGWTNRLMALRGRVAMDSPPPPWDLALYSNEYMRYGVTPEEARRHAAHAWERFLSLRPLLYLPDRKPHGDCDARIERGRRLWKHDELLAFDEVVEKRTQTLLQHQHAVLEHWRSSATRIQAHARGLLARRRVQRMRQHLYEAAQAAARARELAALRRRQLNAAIRIQTVYHRHCAHLRYLFLCRKRVLRSVRLYIFHWQRQRAARVVQRAFRLFHRRVRLASALATLLRLLRLSRRHAELDAAMQSFHAARHVAECRTRELLWERHPVEMLTAKRVSERKAMLRALQPASQRHVVDHQLPRLSTLPNATPSRNQSSSPSPGNHSHTRHHLPRLRR